MHNVAILGAGLISSGFDSPDDCRVLTHAHAVVKHREFNLLGFYDIDINKSRAAAKKWGSRVFQSLNHIENADVAVICTPDKYHLESIKAVLDLNLKLIILEKPVSDTLKDANEIIKLTKNLPVAVNFSRRYVKEFQDLACKIKSDEFGRFISGRGLYGKGFVHNGSHMIDLLNLLIGRIKEIKIANTLSDFFVNDLSKDAELTFESGQRFFMQAIDCNVVTVFELDLFFEKKRVKILSSGKKITYYNVIDYPNGYKYLDFESETDTSLDFAMLDLYNNADGFLTGEEKLLAPLEEVFEEKLYV